jgi:hypothetical protein
MTDDKIIEQIEEYSRDSILYEVQRGMLGHNQGLNNGLGRANEFVHGLQKSTGYLIGGASGTGKTTWADYQHLLCPYFDAKAKNIPFKTIYFSLELGVVRKKIRFASAFISNKFGMRLPVAYILSRGKHRCSQEHWDIVKMIEPEVEEMFDSVQIHTDPPTSRRFAMFMHKFAKQHGTFQTMTVVNEHGDKEEIITGYKLNNPDMVLEVLIDHIGLASEDPGRTLKQTIDNISKCCVWYRNMCGISYTIIQQFGSDMQTTDRRKFDKNEVAPMKIDFADSKYTYNDADIVWGLICPFGMGFPEFKKYDSSRLRTSYIQAFLMKNRDAPGVFNYPLFMDPIAHTFEVLPKAELDLAGNLAKFYARADMMMQELDKTDFSDQKPKLTKQI